MSARQKKNRQGPKAAVIITAFNYEDHIEGAIRSVLEQTHQNFEIVIVDDFSTPASSAKTAKIVKSIRDDRIKLVRNKVNVGQTHSFYIGLDHSTAEFVCLLDPDDRFLPDFLATMLAAHLNPIHIAPLAFCNQQFMRGEDVQLSGTQSLLLRSQFKAGKFDEVEASLQRFGFSSYVEAATRGWIWTSTSSIMYRRDAVEMIRPLRKLPYNHADTYLANGTHLLGGSLFVHKSLVARMIHDKNVFNHSRIFASRQVYGISKLNGGNPALDAAEALFESGNHKLLDRKRLQKDMARRLKPAILLKLLRMSANFRSERGSKLLVLRSLLARLRRG